MIETKQLLKGKKYENEKIKKKKKKKFIYII
jgi:hypothetical protein